MIWFILLAVVILLIIIYIIYRYRNSNSKNNFEMQNQFEPYDEKIYSEEDVEDYYPYHKKYLLTKNEYYFYKNLKELANKYNLQIITKVRLADLIEVNKGLSQNEWAKYFGKIKAKHIDFALVDDMKVVLLIELDDNSHHKPDRKARDTFVDESLIRCDYKVIHTFGNIEPIEKILQNIFI